jgi:outer membrane immunogenic protein
MKQHFKRRLCVLPVFLAAAANTGAQAADAGSTKDIGYAAVEMPATWTGFYTGVGFMGNLSLAGAKAGASGSKYTLPIGSAQGGWVAAGYNRQLGPIVLGIEGGLNYSQTGINGTDAVLGQVSVFEQDLGSVQARAGYAYRNILLYGTGGLELNRNKFGASGVRSNSWNTSLTAGGGVEYAVDRSGWLILRAEAKVYRIDEKNLEFPSGNREIVEDFGVLRIGVLRKF